MSLALFQLGLLSFRRPLIFITTWAFILIGVGGMVITAGGGTITSAITIDGTQSQDVLDDLHAEFPQISRAQGSLVFTAPTAQRLDEGENAAAVAIAARRINDLDIVIQPRDPVPAPAVGGSGAESPGVTPHSGMKPADSATPPSGMVLPSDVTSAAQPDDERPRPLTASGGPVSGVLVSADGTVAMMQLQLTDSVEDLRDGTIERIVDIAEGATSEAGVRVLVSESLKPHTAPLGGSEALGIAFAAVVLILALGSLRAAVLPLITAITGVSIGLGAALGLSNSVEMTSATPVLALMVGLAVGMDYALFIVNRTRRLMIYDDLAVDEAVPRAVGTAGSAVIFAGLTVVIALAGLTLIGISFLTTMALVAAVTVVTAVLIALTLLPALLRLVGQRLVSPRARARAVAVYRAPGAGQRWVSGVVKHRGVVTAVIIVGLLVAAIPAVSMTFGMPDGSTANLNTDERKAYDAVADAFGPGYNAPLITVITAVDGDAFTLMDLPAIASGLEEFDTVDTVRPMAVSPDGKVALATVIPVDGPTAESTVQLVHDLRNTGASHIGANAATVGVAGLAAVNIDISEKLADVFPYYIVIIVVLSLIALALVFRSILVPIKATAGFLLSVGATFGIITAVFQWGWLKDLVGFDSTGPILSFLPIMVTGILYGLAMDYEMFLVSSMREEHVHGAAGDQAVASGYAQASRVVVAAAVIMVSVFAGFVLSEDPMVKQFGLALAVGITIDAFVIRLTLVPALMSYLGDKAWWLPHWLRRLIPHLDVEGARLTEHLRTGAPKGVIARTEDEPSPAR